MTQKICGRSKKSELIQHKDKRERDTETQRDKERETERQRDRDRDREIEREAPTHPVQALPKTTLSTELKKKGIYS